MLDTEVRQRLRISYVDIRGFFWSAGPAAAAAHTVILRTGHISAMRACFSATVAPHGTLAVTVTRRMYDVTYQGGAACIIRRLRRLS